MKILTMEEARNFNGGGKTYVCPFCEEVEGGYWTVYFHALFSGCFKKNSYLNGLWEGAKFCFELALGNEINRFFNAPVGKHMK